MATKRMGSDAVSFRARKGQLEYWREAADEMGYSSLSAWIKDVLTDAATECFKAVDRKHAKKPGRPKRLDVEE